MKKTVTAGESAGELLPCQHGNPAKMQIKTPYFGASGNPIYFVTCDHLLCPPSFHPTEDAARAAHNTRKPSAAIDEVVERWFAGNFGDKVALKSALASITARPAQPVDSVRAALREAVDAIFSGQLVSIGAMKNVYQSQIYVKDVVRWNDALTAALPVDSQPAEQGEPTRSHVLNWLREREAGAFATSQEMALSSDARAQYAEWELMYRKAARLIAATQPAWLPIDENTPTDKPILGGWWYNEQLWAWGQCQYDGGWYGIRGGLPTHYLPLPAPPEPVSAEDEK